MKLLSKRHSATSLVFRDGSIEPPRFAEQVKSTPAGRGRLLDLSRLAIRAIDHARGCP
jgi:hypothetical protein